MQLRKLAVRLKLFSCSTLYHWHLGALCKAAYDGQNPSAIVESLGITDETEVQQLTDFLKRFGGTVTVY